LILTRDLDQGESIIIPAHGDGAGMASLYKYNIRVIHAVISKLGKEHKLAQLAEALYRCPWEDEDPPIARGAYN